MTKTININDKYDLNEGNVYINGNQALVKAVLMRQQADTKLGLETHGYVSGYRGSPLGGLDMEMGRAKKYLSLANVALKPAVNEELAATAIWGTQQIDAYGKKKVDGVFSLWYGKGPGVDRAGDAIRHGNSGGSHQHGGVVVAFGDDHPGKSSTVAHQSEQTLAALSVPSLYPSNVSEIIEYALIGWEMSRETGLWVGLKCVNETVEQTASIALPQFKSDYQTDPDNVNIQPKFFNPKEAEKVVVRTRLPRVHEFVKRRQLNKVVFGADQPRIAIVTAGKATPDTLEALEIMGINDAKAKELSIGVYKVGCIWPLEPTGVVDYVQGAEQIICVEEKRGFLEAQIKEILFNQHLQCSVVGKQDLSGEPLFPADIQLTVLDVCRSLGGILKTAYPNEELLIPICHELPLIAVDRGSIRAPYFCSGCPHNSSTKVPEGSIGQSGIGCHGMVSMHRPETYFPPTQMGGEGLTWVGASEYTETDHVFQNLGDGTYFHSGILSIRAAVASNANITFKVLYNDAVAMTGGQSVDGQLPVPMLFDQVMAEGIVDCVLVTDDLSKYDDAPSRLKSVVQHRSKMDDIQRRLSKTQGVTVIIYEQTCAAEKRRRRKRGLMPDPEKRTFIFDPVCEGCGDCSVQSTCVSVQPKPTPLGLKRQIDQDSCNKDFSCQTGFCPSFITVHTQKVAGRQSRFGEFEALISNVPEPKIDIDLSQAYSILVAGIGGTGVVTVSAILGMAAHIENKSVSIFDMTGLAQKNGTVFSHLRLGNKEASARAARIGEGQSDLILAFDMLSVMSEDARITIDKQRTRLVDNTDVQTTAYFQLNPNDTSLPNDAVLSQFTSQRFNDKNVYRVNANDVAIKLLGNALGTNMFMIGFSYQHGLLPISPSAIEQAIRLNGTAVEMNLAAFELGRLYAHQPDVLLDKIYNPDVKEQTYDERVAFLTDYQNMAWANQFVHSVDAFKSALSSDSLSVEDKLDLVQDYERQLFRLMSYKDEYEIARLYSSNAFKQKLTSEFGKSARFSFNLAPPMLKPFIGNRKIEIGAWLLPVFGILKKGKVLRGTALDIFGYTVERRAERRWIKQYQSTSLKAAAIASQDSLEHVKKLIAAPENIKGFGHVKENNVRMVDAKWNEIKEQLGV